MQERIREADRDTFRFHWIRVKNSSQVETEVHAGRDLETTFIETSRTEYTKNVEEIMKSLYVDDTITAEDTVDQVQEWRRTAIEVFLRRTFRVA